MDKEKPVLNYFLEGFRLANRSLEIYFILLILSLLYFYGTSFPNQPLSLVYSILSFIIFVISVSFSLSVPVFLIQKQQGNALSIPSLLSTTMVNTKRIILPGILIFTILIMFLIATFILIGILLHPTSTQIAHFFQNFDPAWNPVVLILVIIFPFFVFTPLFFSLEKKGLLISIKHSIATCFKHLPYLILVIAIDVLSYSLNNLLPITDIGGSYLKSIISLYISFVIATSTLLYYQKRIKKE